MINEIQILPEELNTYQRHELIQTVIKGILEGASASESLKCIKANSPLPLSKSYSIQVYEQSLQMLKENTELDIDRIISVHLINYEKIYQYFKSINYVSGMNKAMAQKERLLGMHKKRLEGKVNKKITVGLTSGFEYDLSLLSPEKKERLDYLLAKAKDGIANTTPLLAE